MNRNPFGNQKIGSSTAIMMDSIPATQRGSTTGIKVFDRVTDLSTPPRGIEEVRHPPLSSSSGKLAASSISPLKPSMGVSGSICSKKWHSNNEQVQMTRENGQRMPVNEETPTKEKPSCFVTKAELYASSAMKSCSEGKDLFQENPNTRRSQTSTTLRQMNQQNSLNSTCASCKDLRLKSQEIDSTSFPCHSSFGKKSERRIEQVLVKNARTDGPCLTPSADQMHFKITTSGDVRQTTPAEGRQNQKMSTSTHHQTLQEIYTSPTGKNPQKSFSAHRETLRGSDGNSCAMPTSNAHDTPSGNCYETPQHIRQCSYRRASMRARDHYAPNDNNHHRRQNSVHGGPSPATEEISTILYQACCSTCENLAVEVSQMRTRVKALEKQLDEKEYENIQLREIMERNEKAILGSFADVRKRSDSETFALKRDFENYLRAQLQNSFRNEDALRNRIALLTQQTARLQESIATLKSQREEFATRCIRAEWRLERTKNHVTELSLQLNKRRSEASRASNSPGMLDTGLQGSYQIDDRSTLTRVRHWKSEDDMKRLDYSEVGPGTRWHLDMERRVEESTMAESIQILQTELLKARDEMESGKREFEEEKRRWEEEKSKVLSYQRFLQMNYLQLLNDEGIVERDCLNGGDSVNRNIGHALNVIAEEDSV